MLSLAVGSFSSCGSDDDDDDKGGTAAKAVGVYVGSITTLGYNGAETVTVAAVASNEISVSFANSSIADFKVKLVDTGVQGIVQSNGMPLCQFYPETGVTIMTSSNDGQMFTFNGDKE